MDTPEPPAETPAPVLVACAHGTRSADGQRTMAALQRALAEHRPGLVVADAHLDVQEPTLDDTVEALAGEHRRMVIVPLLLSTGYHVRVDVASAADAAGGLAVPAPALGPDPLLADLLDRRLNEAGAGAGDIVVLAAAGSSDPLAALDVERTAAWLSQRRGGVPVIPGYLSAARPSVPEAVAQARARHGRPVSIATYLLAPGWFCSQLPKAGADRVSAPLAPDPVLVELALRRFDAASSLRAPAGAGRRMVG